MMNILMAIFMLLLALPTLAANHPLVLKKVNPAQTSKESALDEKALLKDAKDIFSPLPNNLIDTKKNAELIKLGHKLYMEKKLSFNGSISCNSCHQLDRFGVDNQKTSLGHSNVRGERNSPTVYNAAFNFVQFWDGRAKTLEEQALGPLLNPVEHGIPNKEEAIKILKEANYSNDFKKAFPEEKEPLTFENVGKAIASFERTLVTPSPFDEYLKGNEKALTLTEKKGLKKFMAMGCISCHDGVGIGGGSFQKLGVTENYPTKDMGLYSQTKDEGDKFVFKVPTLRNITKTFPYLHDGSLDNLDEVIAVMVKFQLGEKASAEDIADIKAFLGSLTGTLPPLEAQKL